MSDQAMDEQSKQACMVTSGEVDPGGKKDSSRTHSVKHHGTGRRIHDGYQQSHRKEGDTRLFGV